jgi:glycosyltransferase involved in cell wall biosynthesis
MILAVDGYEANASVRVGVGRYAFEIIAQIAARQRQANRLFDDVRVYVPGTIGAHMPKENPHFHYRITLPRALWTWVGFPVALASDMPAADVVFSPTHYVPRWITTPRVMAIMDVSYLSYPELFRAQDLHKLVHWTAYSVRHAEKIITISEFSKRAIIDAYHVPSERVVVAYPALPDSVLITDMGKREKATALPKKYILSVGTLQPRKNFTRLIEAMKSIVDPDIELLIVGKKGWLYDEILAAPKKYGVENRVRFLDFVPDEALPSLYKHAACFVLPSLYEGFGLPVLEAMAHGTPVVVSSGSSLPEIAGDAGIYVDPSDVSSIAAGISLALTESTNDRKARIQRGKQRVNSFTWENAATKVMDVLSLVGKKGKNV